MKHKVKLLKVQGDFFDCLVDGERCRYFIQRPQPLSCYDALMLRDVMDSEFLKEVNTRFTKSCIHSTWIQSVSPWRWLLLKFWGLSGHILTRIIHADGRVVEEFVLPHGVSKSFGQMVTDYIDKVGVEVDIDKKTRGVVVLKSDVDKIREGKLQ